MAKNTGKTRVTTTTVIRKEGDEPAETGTDELELPEETPAADREEVDAIAKLLELSGGNSMARYEVRKIMPSAEAGYVGTLAAEELTMERLAEEFGPGTYTVRVRLPGGKFAGSDRVQIAPSKRHRHEVAAPLAAPAPAPSSGVAEMIAAMQRGTDAQINMLSGLVKSLIERPLPTPPAPPPPPDTLAILGVAAKLFDRKDSGSGLEMFMKGLEFGKELGGGETDLGDIMLKGIDGLKELSAAQPAPAAPPVRRALPAPGTVPAREPAPSPAPQPTGGNVNTLRLLQWLTKQVQHLLVQAARQKDPELYAEVFLDNLPPGLSDETILAQLQAPDALEKLAKLDARVLQYRPWFTEFRDACVAQLTAPLDDEDDDETGPDVSTGDLPAEFPAETGGNE